MEDFKDLLRQQYLEFKRLVFASIAIGHSLEANFSTCLFDPKSYSAVFADCGLREAENSKLRSIVLPPETLEDHRRFQKASFPLLESVWDQPTSVRSDCQLLKMYTYPEWFVTFCPNRESRIRATRKLDGLVEQLRSKNMAMNDRWNRAINHLGLSDNQG